MTLDTISTVAFRYGAAARYYVRRVQGVLGGAYHLVHRAPSDHGTPMLGVCLLPTKNPASAGNSTPSGMFIRLVKLVPTAAVKLPAGSSAKPRSTRRSSAR